MPSSTVRLSDALMGDCRARCEHLGISFNALVAVALDQYLRGARVAEPVPVEPATGGPVAGEPAGDACPPGLSKRERREWRRTHGMPAYG